MTHPQTDEVQYLLNALLTELTNAVKPVNNLTGRLPAVWVGQTAIQSV